MLIRFYDFFSAVLLNGRYDNLDNTDNNLGTILPRSTQNAINIPKVRSTICHVAKLP